MTIRVNKDAFNLRDKLSELDYDRLPYDKMPGGSIVQFKTNASDTLLSHNTSTYVDLVQLDFSPKFESSNLFVTLNCNIRLLATSNNRQRIYFRLIRTDSGGETTVNQYSELLQIRNANLASSNVELCFPVHIESLDNTAKTTSTINYKWMFMSGDSTAFDTNNNIYRISIYEIQQ